MHMQKEVFLFIDTDIINFTYVFKNTFMCNMCMTGADLLLIFDL